MIQLRNNTPFAAGSNIFRDRHGTERLTVILKATFVLPEPGHAAKLADQQLPLLLADEYFGDPQKTGIRYPADLVPEKPATDIGLIGSAYSPDGNPQTRLKASIQAGSVSKTVLVTGNRYWYEAKKNKIASPTTPQTFVSIPLTYEHAFGGSDNGETYTSNPIGTGFMVDAQRAHGRKLPNIEDPRQLISRPSDRPPSAGFGFISPSWEDRRKYTGTCDDAWRLNQFPLPPMDFDPRFYNAAAPGLIAPSYLEGGEEVRLVNLSPKGILEFALPGLSINLVYRLFRVERHATARIWTVCIEPDAERFSLTWGASIETHGQKGQLQDILLVLDRDTASKPEDV